MDVDGFFLMGFVGFSVVLLYVLFVLIGSCWMLRGFDVGFRWVFVGAYASPAILMTDSCEGENVFSKRFLWMSFSTKCNAPRIGGNKNHPKEHREWCGRVWGVARLSKKHPKGISRKTSWIKLLGLLAVTCGTLAIVKV